MKDLNGLTVLDHDETIRPDTSARGPGRPQAELRPDGRRRGLRRRRAREVPLGREDQPRPPRRQHLRHRRRRGADGDRHRAGRQRPRPHPARPDHRRPPSPAPTRRSCSPVPPRPPARRWPRPASRSSDIDLFEINEAFAAVAMRFMRDMGISHEITNVNGGAIAMGHPLGATGAMILGTLIDELARRDLQARPRHALRRRRHGHRHHRRARLSAPSGARLGPSGLTSTTATSDKDHMSTTALTPDRCALRARRRRHRHPDPGRPDASANTMNELYIDSMEAAVDRLYAEQDRRHRRRRRQREEDLLRRRQPQGAWSKATKDDAADDLRAGRGRQGRRCAGSRSSRSRSSPRSTAPPSAAASRSRWPATTGSSSTTTRVKIGLPESSLGLLPGGGGVTRIVRMLGLQPALMDVLLQGTQFKPAAGARRRAWSTSWSPPARSWSRPRRRGSRPTPTPARTRGTAPATRCPAAPRRRPRWPAFLPAFPALLRKQTKGAVYPAARAIL